MVTELFATFFVSLLLELIKVKHISQNFDYLGNLKKIDVPLISFQSRLGLLFWGPFNAGIKSKDVTNGGEYPEFGHMDIYTGTTNPEKVNLPTLNWLNKHR